MVEAGIYHYLIYYHRIKLLKHLIFAIALTVFTVVVLALVYYLWKISIYDVIIVGGGPIAEEFNYHLKKMGVKSFLILPPRQTNLCLDNWVKRTSRQVSFPAPKQKELDHLSDMYGLNVQEVGVCNERDDACCGLADKIKGRYQPISTYQLESCRPDSQDYVKQIDQEENLGRVHLTSGRVVTSRVVFIVDINVLDLAEKYLDLDRPSGIKLSQKYINSSLDIRGVIQKQDDLYAIFSRHKIELTGVNFNESVSLRDQIGLDMLPPTKSCIDHVFFPWRNQGVVVLDTTNIVSSFPSRDLLFVIHSLVRELARTKNGYIVSSCHQD